MSIKDTFIYEWLHFTKSKLKVITLLLFSIAAVYGLQNGYQLFKEHVVEINDISKKQNEAYQTIFTWLDENKSGPDERPYVDISKPLWAFYYIPSWTWKQPSPMMVFNIGQAEQFGYYKKVTDWSTAFDSDLSEELANPERLAMNSLDFCFVILYLSPLLLIILLYNIKGYEKDNGILKLIYVQSSDTIKWLAARTSFYFILVSIVLIILMLVYASICGVIKTNLVEFIYFIASGILYLLAWVLALLVIITLNNSSMAKAISMISLWLIFCLVLPAFVQQSASLKYPTIYMTDFLDAKRTELYELYDLYELPQDSLKIQLLKPELKLQSTIVAKDSIIDQTTLSNTMPYLANLITKPAAKEILIRSEKKNQFIRNSYWYNPITFYLNHLNSICNTDYYAYQNFREHIQNLIDIRTSLRAMDTWNKEVIDKERIQYYMETFGQGKY